MRDEERIEILKKGYGPIQETISKILEDNDCDYSHPSEEPQLLRDLHHLQAHIIGVFMTAYPKED